MTSFDGSEVELNLMVFCGHTARVLVATTDAIERARDIVVDAGLADTVTGLGREAGELQSLMVDLTKIVAESRGE